MSFMRCITLLLCLSFSAIAFSQNDTTKIIQLIKDDYKTMLNMDISKHISNCTHDYLLIEDGDILDMDKESKWYRDEKNRVTDRKDNFSFYYIRIDGNVAYAVYNLKSDIIKEGKIKQRNWNESVVLRKVDSVWKIALIHSTTFKQ